MSTMSTTLAPTPLSAEQVAFFEREGYLVVEDVFDDAVLRAVTDELTREIDRRARELVDRGELSRTYEECGFEHRLARISAETDRLALSIWDGSLNGAAIFELIRYAPLLDIAEQFCGPEIIASSVYRVRPKIPNNIKSPVPWHQDSGYFEAYCDDALVLTVWLPLVDATEANGCLWVKPQSHCRGIIEHRTHPERPYLLIRDEDLPGDVEAVCVPVPRGGALFMTNMTPHASFENTTDGVRWSMDLRYQSAKLPTNAAITRLPGEATSDEEHGVPPACYPPEADFLVRSRARPDEVVNTAEQFHRLRTGHASGKRPGRWKPLDA